MTPTQFIGALEEGDKLAHWHRSRHATPDAAAYKRDYARWSDRLAQTSPAITAAELNTVDAHARAMLHYGQPEGVRQVREYVVYPGGLFDPRMKRWAQAMAGWNAAGVAASMDMERAA